MNNLEKDPVVIVDAAVQSVRFTKRRITTRLFLHCLLILGAATLAAVFGCPFNGLQVLWGVGAGYILAWIVVRTTPPVYANKFLPKE